MNVEENDWRPTCSVEMLRLRSELLRTVRQFFHGRRYLEAETPLLSRDMVIDAHLHPFPVRTEQGTWYLQTSPEACLKRLLAAGSGSVFEVTKSFRGRETGRRHNPEFTMVEWYGVAATLADQMELTEDLVRACFNVVRREGGSARAVPLPDHPFLQTRYDDAFERSTGSRVTGRPAADLRRLARRNGIVIPDSVDPEDCDGILNVLLAVQVEPELGLHTPEFLYDYPASQAALAQISETHPPFAQRFELYIRGVEVCNGYRELTDFSELQRRELHSNQLRHRDGECELPGAQRLLAAMRHGLPDCTGVALGFDRLVMLASGATDIREVIPFPFDRA